MTYHSITLLKICASDWMSRRCIEPTCRGAAGLPDIAAGLLTLFQSVCHAMKLRQQQVLFGNSRSPSPLPCVRQPSPLPCPRQHPVALPAWKENHKCVWSHAGAPSSAGIASVLSWPSPPTTTKTSCRSAPIAGQVSMASRGSPRRDPIYDHAQYRRRVPVSQCGRLRL